MYARIRPSKSFSPSHFAFDPTSQSITLTLPPSSSTTSTSDQTTRDYVNNQRLTYPFTFHHLFPPSTSNATVFTTLGQQCVTHLLDGFNSTIFAYGQTGSGKTFTITGGADRYDDRGIIPRTLTHLFDQLASPALTASPTSHTVLISYLEIYNEVGYDLLTDRSDLSTLSQLPRVTLLDTSHHSFHLQNLSTYPVAHAQAALELLFRGDTNRMICETPSNDASSRSHCIFSITLEARDRLSSSLRRSKLHLVDLAGSERIKKTQVTGRLFKEAAFINLSLHHLEQVILALHHRSTRGATTTPPTHIPYRNSMMTSVLRDSLGGNCRTYMIATLSGEVGHLEETVSTARFATRVGQVRNEVWVEVEEDVEGMVRRLKGEVKQLKEEVRRLRGEEGVGRGEALTEEEVTQCRDALHRFLQQGEGQEDPLPLGHEERVRTYLRLLKAMVRGTTQQGQGGPDTATQEELQRLTATVRERDAEIARLTALHRPSLSPLAGPTPTPTPAVSATAAAASAGRVEGPVGEGGEGGGGEEEFDLFRSSYAACALLEVKKEELRELIGKAKGLGEGINGSREVINRLKQRLQARRVQREMSRGGEEGGGEGDGEEEERLRVGVEEEKRRYREQFEELKVRKEEIEHLKATIERSRRRMQADYQQWRQQRGGERPAPQEEKEAMQPPQQQPQQRPLQQPSLPSPTERGALSRMIMAGAVPSAPSAPPAPLSSAPPPPPLPFSSTATASAVQPGNGDRRVSTGNAQADADIERFYALRNQLLQQAAAIQGAVTAIR